MLVDAVRHPARAPRHDADQPADVEWLIDNADAYRALVAAIRGAQRTLWISQLALDVDCVVYELAPAPVRLVDELVDAARRGVEVRVLLNASLLLDTAKALREFFAAADCGPGRVFVRGVSRFPQLLHAKVLASDDAEAFLIGSPFVNGYWDDARHAPVDERRPTRELGGRPLHDLSVRLTGAPVRRVRRVFAELWNAATDVEAGDATPIPMPAAPALGAPPSAVRVLCTAPVRSSPTRRRGRMEILPALLHGLSLARELVYVEHQYLSARPVIDALAQALAREPALEVVVVLNQNPDVTAYRGWQNRRLADAGLMDHPRVGLFALWTAARDVATGVLRLNQLFVHSKVVTVDDRWAMVGSANLDGVSLHSYGDDFSSRLGRRVFRGVRNFDVNALLQAGPEADDPIAARVRELRDRLWREHLGRAATRPDARPAAGWLHAWRAAAARNVAALSGRGRESSVDGSFILPYSTLATPQAQLADAGVVFAPSELELCFEPSWLEVHCSPNWVRNMFG